jgi:hypothetical protein
VTSLVGDDALNEVLLRTGRYRQAPESSTLPNGRVSEEEELNEVLRRSILDLSLREILKDSDLVSYTTLHPFQRMFTHRAGFSNDYESLSNL